MNLYFHIFTFSYYNILQYLYWSLYSVFCCGSWQCCYAYAYVDCKMANKLRNITSETVSLFLSLIHNNTRLNQRKMLLYEFWLTNLQHKNACFTTAFVLRAHPSNDFINVLEIFIKNVSFSHNRFQCLSHATEVRICMCYRYCTSYYNLILEYIINALTI